MWERQKHFRTKELKRKYNAGADWLSAFIKRHPTRAIRTPESTSIAGVSAFNKENTILFSNRLAA